MAEGTEAAPIEFEFEQQIGVKFTAADLVEVLTPIQIIELVKELDLELGCWEATVLLASYFGKQMKVVPAEIAATPDNVLVDVLHTVEDSE